MKKCGWSRRNLSPEVPVPHAANFFKGPFRGHFKKRISTYAKSEPVRVKVVINPKDKNFGGTAFCSVIIGWRLPRKSLKTLRRFL